MKAWLAAAAINGFLAVAAGAFAAHALQSRIEVRGLQVFDTGARYQMFHALAIGLAAFAMHGAAARPAKIAAWLFLAGIVLFSGSLYALALSDIRAFGFVTPVGGMAFLAGWLALAWTAMRLPR
ncbi:MAG: DUF423 domain-containing protein [Alphaproteobacteria bacterium]|nr:DUF423 domain-containing protein [Alphaproteobacteria bacterium]